MPKRKFAACFRCACAKIHLVDKCLLVFMAVLLVQSGYVLFVPEVSGTDANHIDVAVRTSAAAIFGYFLSANFIRHAVADDPPPVLPPRQTGDDAPPSPSAVKNQVGFAVPQTDAETPPETPRAENWATAGRLQILVAAGIGLFSLLILLLLRNIAVFHSELSPSSSAVATVTQLRDFVSGCVGFLIGSPTVDRAK